VLTRSFENGLLQHFVEYPVEEAQQSSGALAVEYPVINAAVFRDLALE
jgi:hypothetical protein